MVQSTSYAEPRIYFNIEGGTSKASCLQGDCVDAHPVRLWFCNGQRSSVEPLHGLLQEQTKLKKLPGKPNHLSKSQLRDNAPFQVSMLTLPPPGRLRALHQTGCCAQQANARSTDAALNAETAILKGHRHAAAAGIWSASG
ncbi:hypothetical protein MMC29_000854 [Sticta canariensis]|nr:hypothetical protein [Sticta canariensis]